MKRKLPWLFLALLFPLLSVAQPYGNEWIDFSKKYLKVKVSRNGIHRIDSTALANGLSSIGVSLSSINPQHFQLFWRGQEQYIYISGESDNVFNSGDFLEFIGKRNDGAPDSSLYGGSSSQPNPYASLYNDTSAYFLTWNSQTNNRRMIPETDTSFSSFTPSPYFLSTERWSPAYFYYQGETDIQDMTDPDFVSTEGWFDYEFNFGGSRTVPLNSRNAYTGSCPYNADITMKVVSLSNDFNIQIPFDNFIRIQFLSTQLDTFYDGYKTGRYSFSVPPASLNSSSTSFTVSSLNNAGAVSSGRTAIAFIHMQYPHSFDMEGRTYFEGRLPDDQSQAKSLLVMNNFITTGLPAFVYDLTNHRRCEVVLNSGVFRSLVPNSGGLKEFAFGSEYDMVTITSLQPVGANGSFTDFLSLPHDSAFLMVAPPALWSVAVDYKNYRSSAAGGFRDVLLADIHELYDQFAYGIGQHPLAIRRFADFIYDATPNRPQQLFLFGKSLSPDITRNNTTNYRDNLVPTFGYPPSDNLFTAGINGTQWECAIPVGRLSARDSVQARWYYDKVVSYESQPPAEWMKNVLHFGGGAGISQQQLFANYLAGYENTIENDTSFGGVVQTWLKTSSAPIQIIQSDTLRQRIEDGVSIMNFFGHASGTGFDQSIDDPNNYNNINRYPFLIANSCFAGDIHTTGISSSELFVLLQNKGVIGYLASTGIGLAGYLNEFTSRFYKQIAQTSYGENVGTQIKRAIQQYEIVNTFPQAKFTALQMTLHGDPAVIINSQKKPDYEISNADVWFDQVSQVDSITVFAEMTNIGKAVRDTYLVQMIRRFPNGDTISYLKQIPAPFFKDTISFRIPVDQVNGIGLNKIRITLDLYSQIDELSESNNSTNPDVDLLIQGRHIVPVWPYEFAVIPRDTVTLKASTANPFEPLRTYRFQLDTTDLFNSPALQSTLITAPGGVVTWKPPVFFTDSTVYYWRVSPDSTSPANGYSWRESSFQYISGKVGWGQAHYFQYKNDGYQYVKYNRPLRRWDFVNDIKVIDSKNGIYGPTVPWNEVWYKINGATQHIFTCALPGMSIAVFNPASGNPWITSSPTAPVIGPLGNYICVPEPQLLYAHDFADFDTTWRGRIRDFIAQIPNGHHVLIYSQHLHNKSQYDANLMAQLQSIGASSLTSVLDTTAFIIFGTKGAAPNSAHETVGANQLSVLTQQDTIVSNWNEGYVQSPVIGPAFNWGSFHWRQRPFETPDHDSVYVVVTGIRANGQEDSLVTFPEDSTDVPDLYNYANAATYPYLKLTAYMKDDTMRTPVQMKRWQVLYTPVPEAAVNPPLAYSLYNDTLQEGEQLQLAMAVQNISDYPFNDSLELTYWIIDGNRVRHDLPPKLRPPVFTPWSWFTDTLRANTEGYPGWNELWLEVNPVGRPNSQLEQYHFNNIAVQRFYVGTDRINPLLDVTFDGVHIMNGDIVSARPSILVQLKDENQFLALNDTSDFRLFLRAPSQTVPQLLPWNSDMIFTPAVLPDNSCKILYNPQLLSDGIYELTIQAKDRSDNQSGTTDYKVQFEVINKPSITNVFNYPNPFSTSTRFVFTLTGSDVPDVFSIQIMTITGKVVRTIDRTELGDLHIGKNITEFAWDGRDEFGDLLANGIYLYRVVTRLNGASIEQRETSADYMFKAQMGKMYIIR